MDEAPRPGGSGLLQLPRGCYFNHSDPGDWLPRVEIRARRAEIEGHPSRALDPRLDVEPADLGDLGHPFSRPQASEDAAHLSFVDRNRSRRHHCPDRSPRWISERRKRPGIKRRQRALKKSSRFVTELSFENSIRKTLARKIAGIRGQYCARRLPGDSSATLCRSHPASRAGNGHGTAGWCDIRADQKVSGAPCVPT